MKESKRAKVQNLKKNVSHPQFLQLIMVLHIPKAAQKKEETKTMKTTN
jgi:hypothetical protein